LEKFDFWDKEVPEILDFGAEEMFVSGIYNISILIDINLHFGLILRGLGKLGPSK
jgi:hypothetical protein